MSRKSFSSNDGYEDGDRTNRHYRELGDKTYESAINLVAGQKKKGYGKESGLSYPGDTLVDSRNRLVLVASCQYGGFGNVGIDPSSIRPQFVGSNERK
jgi:hypothetical protein